MKMKNTLGLAMAAIIAMGLSGCEEENPAETAKDEADIDANTRAQLNKDEIELKEELKKAQAKDPSIKDMYYGTDDEGNKVVHVIREIKDPATGQATAHDSTLPMLQGMVLGMLMSNMMNGGGGYSSRTYPMSQSRSYRNSATSRYSASTRSTMQRSYVSARPSSAYSTRSAGALSSSSSSRSSGYSAGG